MSQVYRMVMALAMLAMPLVASLPAGAAEHEHGGAEGGHGKPPPEPKVQLAPMPIVVDGPNGHQFRIIIVTIEFPTLEQVPDGCGLVPRFVDQFLSDMYTKPTRMLPDGRIDMKVMSKRASTLATTVFGRDLMKSVTVTQPDGIPVARDNRLSKLCN